MSFALGFLERPGSLQMSQVQVLIAFLSLAAPVIRASPPPWTARPDHRGLSVGVCHATARASRVASIPLFHACCRHYPGGTGRCLRRSLPDPCQPSSSTGRVGFRINSFEACSVFARATARMVAGPPKAALVIEVLQPMSLPPSSAPTATGWSDSCRAGFAPAEDWRLRTAHQLSQVWDRPVLRQFCFC